MGHQSHQTEPRGSILINANSFSNCTCATNTDARDFYGENSNYYNNVGRGVAIVA